ncbi:MAG: hypothetical protein DLM50_09050 [Candidatus Meridianibacter frigidus]|nr:MAG: hypothetical protein DLM50_09050 [Candidatus Eremiobacteraeota bacterium]
MQPYATAALAALGGALVALAIYHFLAVAPVLARISRALQAQDELVGGDAGAAGGRIATLENTLKGLALQSEREERRLLELERLSQTDVSGVGFFRYNAFADTGSELSFALALLNRQGDGVVLSSIYSREDTRTYGKAVSSFRALQDASKEELSAIARAGGEKT